MEMVDKETERLTTISIKGMTCQSCVKSIKNSLEDVPGIASINISLTDDRGSFTYIPKHITAEIIASYLENTGFEASVLTDVVAKESDTTSCELLLTVLGMTCQSCVNSIEKCFKDDLGIISVDVNLQEESALIIYKKDSKTKEDIVKTIEEAGFDVFDKNLDQCLNDCSVTHVQINDLETQKQAFSIKDALEKLDGIFSVRVFLKSKSGTIKHSLEKINVGDIIAHITDLGFDCSLKAVGECL